MKKRLDVLLTELGYFESRTKAQATIMAGRVFIDGKKIDKPGTKFKEIKNVEIKERLKYVSRGALKLKTAYEEFNLDFKDKVCMDIGASTGGFTDFMLDKGAKKVYAIDVGYGQLHYKLRNDERVVNLEKTNFRYFDEPELYEKFDVIVGDLSFISITKIFENAMKYLKKDGIAVFLVKPQFEAGKGKTEKGVVKDEEIRKEVLFNIVSFVFDSGYFVNDVCISGIKGAKKGNVEFLILISRRKSDKNLIFEKIEKIVE
jgi:23S rRNA (cytidine1920-2'-O)/16S rRNA (cytidine1409-2'-O)-methyltransferase